MPYDPNLPQENTLIDAAQMRAQLQALHDLIQARPTMPEVGTAIGLAIAGTSSNSNAVNQLSLTADSTYQQTQMQAVLDKLDELILALRR